MNTQKARALTGLLALASFGVAPELPEFGGSRRKPTRRNKKGANRAKAKTAKQARKRNRR